MRSPLFEVTSTALSLAARRLTTAAKVRTMVGSPEGDDTKLETLIDRVSDAAANYCGLARDVYGAIPSFGVETCRATRFVLGSRNFTMDRYAGAMRGPTELILPWRTPITAITSVVEGGVTLTGGGVDYQLMGGGLLARLSSDAPLLWAPTKIVVVYVAGWSLPTGVPPALEAAVIEQVKTAYINRGQDPTLRSENVPDLYQASYTVAGLDSVGSFGLMPQVLAALAPYKNWAIG